MWQYDMGCKEGGIAEWYGRTSSAEWWGRLSASASVNMLGQAGTISCCIIVLGTVALCVAFGGMYHLLHQISIGVEQLVSTGESGLEMVD